MAKWKYNINIKEPMNDITLSFEQIRDQVVFLLKNGRGIAPFKSIAFQEILEGLANSRDTDEFDDYLKSLYDFADKYRIWLGSRLVL